MIGRKASDAWTRRTCATEGIGVREGRTADRREDHGPSRGGGLRDMVSGRRRGLRGGGIPLSVRGTGVRGARARGRGRRSVLPALAAGRDLGRGGRARVRGPRPIELGGGAHPRVARGRWW